MESQKMKNLLPEQTEIKKHTVESKGGGFIIIEETKPGTFKIISDSATKKNGDRMVDATNIGFHKWDDSVQNLDDGYSDSPRCFGMSEHLQWKDVELTASEIKAPSLDRLKEALQHIEITSYCPGDL